MSAEAGVVRKPPGRFGCVLAACVALAGMLGAAPAVAVDAPSIVEATRRVLASDYAQLHALYLDLHAHPELGFEEKRTAASLAQQMRSAGFEVSEGIGGTGLVAIYRNGPGPTVMVRTELDALPLEELSGLPHASRVKTQYNGTETFVAHSCGHDIHMAAWVGTARALLALKNLWRGTLMFVAQPAEERVRGARAMLEEGLFTRFGRPDMGFALHVMPGAHDEVFYRSGAATSNGSGLEIVFQGRGGHGSNPSDTIDPVMMAGRFVVDVQSVVSREKDPAAFGVVSIGTIQGGSAGNIIPDSVVVRGTVRSQSDEVHQQLQDGVTRTANAVAAMARAEAPRITFSAGVKAVINDASLASRTGAAFRAGLGVKARQMPAAWSGGEDYGEFIAAGVPSFFFGIGAHSPEQIAAARAAGRAPPANHSPQFAPAPDPTIRTGVTAMTLAVITALEPERKRK